MGRFNVQNWTPRSDSTPDLDYDDLGVNPETTVVLDRPTERSCFCGCQAEPSGRGRSFAMGHDARLRGKLIRAHLTGTPVMYIGAGGTGQADTAMAFAAEHGWAEYLKTAEKRQGPTIRAKLEASNSRVIAAAVGPQIGDRRLVRVGRWDYTGQVLAVYDDGGRFEIEYVTKKGDVVRTEVPADRVGTIVVGEA